MKKLVFLVLSLVLSISQIFAMSVLYKDTKEAYDSDVLLEQFTKDENKETENSIKDIGILFWGPGNAPHLYYGHVGLVVEYEDASNMLYDYGVFNPSEKGFVKEVIHGRMFYQLSRTPINVDYTFAISESSKRGMRYYVLNGLDDEKKEYIASFLEFNYNSDRQKYLYNFFSDNCSTRVRDILDVAYGGALSEIGERYYGTRRMSIEEQTEPHTIVEMVYGIAEGYLQDRPITYYDAMFLPSYLELALKELTVENEDGDIIPLLTLQNESTWENAWPYETSFNTHNSNWFPLILIAIILVVLNSARTISLSFLHKDLHKQYIAIRVINKVYAFINAFVLLFIFILSLAMLFLQFYTLIDCGWKNENSIFINPLIIISVYYSFKALFIPSLEKEEVALKKLSLWSLIFFILTFITLVLKIVLPHQANMLHITSFGLYYLSLVGIDKTTINKIKKWFFEKRRFYVKHNK